MIKVLLLVWIFLLSGQGESWRETKSFTLKKDEIAKIVIKTASPKQEKVFFWRWTLYTDKALVVHENFDRFVGQHILTLERNQAFRKRLLNALKSEKDVPYGIVVFKKFDEKKKTATFDFLLIDKEKRVVLEYVTKKEERQ
ncbi:MAG: hypothetical protein ACXWB0_03270 [Sulfuricurvum sp.]